MLARRRAPITTRKNRGAVAPLYRSDRGDICSDRILSREEKLSDVGKIVSNQDRILEPAELWTRVGELKLRFWRAGAGTPLVLLHGLLGYSFSWRHAIPILARSATVFAPDMPGAGLSECSPKLDGRLLSAADRVLGFLNAAAISSCDLVGSSYGGTTAMIVAGLAPSRIRSLILVSPANPWSRNGRRRLTLLQNPAVAWVFPTLARPMRSLHSYFVQRMYGDPRKITRETLRGYARPLSMPGRFEHAVKIVKTWNEDMRELEATLSHISAVPTLLVWGSKDRVVDPASARRLGQHFQNLRTAVIPGAGHLPYEECPEEFCRVLADFLADSQRDPREPHGK
jgi:pimeloyl-ACP methyl ester carboxylesterase